MLAAATLAAALLSAAPAPDLALHAAGSAEGRLALDPGPFRPGELVGAGLGTVAGDAAVLGAAVATYHLFTSGSLAASATNFRNAALLLGAATLLLPPLGAVLGGRLALSSPADGAGWKAFLLSLAGQVAAIAAAYLAAPQYWVMLPVQLATLSAGTSFGLHWGGSRARPLAGRAEPAAPPATASPLALAPALCVGG